MPSQGLGVIAAHPELHARKFLVPALTPKLKGAEPPKSGSYALPALPAFPGPSLSQSAKRCARHRSSRLAVWRSDNRIHPIISGFLLRHAALDVNVGSRLRTIALTGLVIPGGNSCSFLFR